MIRNRPWPVVIVCLMFVVAGAVGFIYHFPDLFRSGSELYDAIGVGALRLIAVICAILLWMGVGWARWLAIAWLLYHVFIGAQHSTSQVVNHVIILIFVALFLYLPKSRAFFNGGRKKIV